MRSAPHACAWAGGTGYLSRPGALVVRLSVRMCACDCPSPLPHLQPDSAFLALCCMLACLRLYYSRMPCLGHTPIRSRIHPSGTVLLPLHPHHHCLAPSSHDWNMGKDALPLLQMRQACSQAARRHLCSVRLASVPWVCTANSPGHCPLGALPASSAAKAPHCTHPLPPPHRPAPGWPCMCVAAEVCAG